MQKRKNIRLAEFDYSQSGGYFITICTDKKRQILSRVVVSSETERAKVELTELGWLALETMNKLTPKYGFRLDTYVIMPNHIHMVIFKEAEEKTVGMLIGAIKSVVTNRWCAVCDEKGVQAGKIWQRNYYDHILRNEADYIEKRKYIEDNPDKWHLDELHIM